MGVRVPAVKLRLCNCAEEAVVPPVRGERDGERLRRRAQGFDQPSDGEPRESAGDEGQQRRVQVLAAEVQEIQQVRTRRKIAACRTRRMRTVMGRKRGPDHFRRLLGPTRYWTRPRCQGEQLVTEWESSPARISQPGPKYIKKIHRRQTLSPGPLSALRTP